MKKRIAKTNTVLTASVGTSCQLCQLSVGRFVQMASESIESCNRLEKKTGYLLHLLDSFLQGFEAPVSLLPVEKLTHT